MRILLVLLIIIFPLIANSDSIFEPGEYIEYEVSYLGISLGNIKIKSTGYDEINGHKTLFAKATMLSHENIPFIKLKANFESWMSEEINRSYGFTGNTYMSGGGWTYEKIQYDEGTLLSERWLNKELQDKKTFKDISGLNDGLSLFFMARQYAGCGKKLNIPVVVSNKVENTIISFYSKPQAIEITSIEEPVKSNYIKGRADWKGIYGLSGEFEGWFSADEAKVPLLAYLNVIVGKVKIELVKWHRPGWKPPVL